MEHQGVETFQRGEVGCRTDHVPGQVEVLQVDVLNHFKVESASNSAAVHLVEVVHGLDVVVGQAEPGEQVDVLQPLDGHQVVRREVKNLA